MPPDMRRSSRAAPPTSTSSSTSSRHDRNGTAPAHQKSATPHSLSSEELSEPPRRSKRAHPLLETETSKAQDVTEEEVANEDGDDGEITRCVCGQQEYPGPPLSEVFESIEAQSDDAGGLFIQCDGCSVWQHGGCVGIVDESHSPDKYYCELCRPKQHTVHVDERGQKYSLYLPVTGKLTSTRKQSMSKSSEDKPRRETLDRASADPATGKRRATMRSREHDEEAEQIQRAIEESAREAGKRNGKRSREESTDEYAVPAKGIGRSADDCDSAKQELKRQRRASESVPAVARMASLDYDSEDDDGTAPTSRNKKAKAEAAQSARQAEQLEKDRERDRARAEAAGRRQERAGRRRADENDNDESNQTHSGSQSPPASSRPNSPSSFAAADRSTQARKGPGKKVKKLGNNQYTKHREANASSPHNRKYLNTSGGTSSGDEQAPNSEVNAATPAQEGTSNHNGHGRGRWGKAKRGNINGFGTRHITSEPMERTIPNMSRNLEGMMAFIQRAQLEVAEDRARVSNGDEHGRDGKDVAASSEQEKNAMELADQLTRNIKDWHERFSLAAAA